MGNRFRLLALALASFVLSLGACTKIFVPKKPRTILIGFLIGLYLTVGWIPAIASVPSAFTPVDTPGEKPQQTPIADVCLPFVGCVEQRIRQEVNSAFKNQLRKLLVDELPIQASDQQLLKAVPHNQLPGGAFQGRPLPLTNFDRNFVIPPGDYIIKAHFYCTRVFTFNGRGNRFPLARLQGKAAEALSKIYARASFDGGVSTDDLQRLSWNTQAGLSWAELSDTDREIIQKYAPEYQNVYSKGLPERIETAVNSLSRLTGGRIPSMDTLLNQLGDVGKLVNTLLRARQEILNTNNGYRARLDVQQLAPLFAPERDANLSGGVEVTPWSQISDQIYARFISPQGAMRDGEIQIRVLADDTSNESKANRKKPCANPVAGIQAGLIAEQITSTVGISEANGHQGISTSLAREPVSDQDAQNAVLKQQAQTFFDNAIDLYRKGEYLNAGRAFTSAIEVMSQQPEGAAILSQILDLLPYIGDLKGVLEAVYGYDLLTGDKLSWFDRAVAALPFDKQIGVLWNSIKKSPKAPPGGQILCRDSSDTTTPPSGNNSRLVFEPSPKHGRENRGNISRGPTNGQIALDNSVQVSDTSTRRVGVDRANNEIVVFDETRDGIFHGHVRSWEELRQEMKNALIRAGLVDSRGRIK
ncbi:MAG TPA: hypothetical protein DCY88_26130 [Cyanobacteria bacterium UBA11372]|nr:hypothetical protein [Cyanobacteria bacterium UBA11372]